MANKKRTIENLEAYFNQLAGMMGLGDWELVISVGQLDEAHAVVSPLNGRKKAYVTFESEWTTRTNAELRHVCIHELLHCHLHPIDKSVSNLRPAIGEAAYSVYSQSHSDIMETIVDNVAALWAKHLPLPPFVDIVEVRT